MCVDSSGLGNHGTYVGGFALAQPGADPGSATSVDFDGSTGYVDIPGSASLDALLDDLSVAAWIEADVVQLQRVFSNRRPSGSGSGGSWSFGTLPNGLLSTTLGVQDHDQPAPVVCCTWHHVALTFDANSQATFHLDGVAVGVVGGAQPSNPPGSANQYLIGVLDLGGSIGRYVGPGQIKNSGAQGSFDLPLNLSQTPSPAGFAQVLAGETWNFQCWYRDAVAGVATSNFTDGLSVGFF